MARTELRLTDAEFWNMAPRTLMAMIDEKKKIDEYGWKVLAFLNQGGQLPEDPDEEIDIYVHPDAF